MVRGRVSVRIQWFSAVGPSTPAKAALVIVRAHPALMQSLSDGLLGQHVILDVLELFLAFAYLLLTGLEILVLGNNILQVAICYGAVDDGTRRVTRIQWVYRTGLWMVIFCMCISFLNAPVLAMPPTHGRPGGGGGRHSQSLVWSGYLCTHAGRGLSGIEHPPCQMSKRHLNCCGGAATCQRLMCGVVLRNEHGQTEGWWGQNDTPGPHSCASSPAEL